MQSLADWIAVPTYYNRHNSMKRFPFSHLKPKMGWITASLIYNPHCSLPPTVWHTITLEIEPIELGSDAVMPEHQKAVDSQVIFDGLPIKAATWNSMDGTYSFGDEQNGSFYVSFAHNPVTVRELSLRYRGGTAYDVDATATFHFEYEDSGYADETTRLVFPAVYTGFSFSVPHWSNPANVSLPPEWGVPSTAPEWPSNTIRDFVQKHFDLSQFAEVTIEDRTLHAKPTTA